MPLDQISVISIASLTASQTASSTSPHAAAAATSSSIAMTNTIYSHNQFTMGILRSLVFFIWSLAGNFLVRKLVFLQNGVRFCSFLWVYIILCNRGPQYFHIHRNSLAKSELNGCAANTLDTNSIRRLHRLQPPQ